MAKGKTKEIVPERLVRFTISGLFGHLNHDVVLSPDGVTILHGANGSGKTTLLKAVDDVSRVAPVSLLRIPFEELCLYFESGLVLKITNGESEAGFALFKGNRRLYDPWKFPKTLEHPASLKWFTNKQFDEHMMWRLYAEHDEYLNYKVIGDLSDDEKRSYLMYRLRKEGMAAFDPPPWLSEFKDGFHCSLIEEQRLIKLVTEGANNTPKIKRQVEDYSDQIKKLIGDATRRYGEQSQQLEKSFPRRMVALLSHPAQRADIIQEEFAALNMKRRELQESGLYESEKEDSLGPLDTESLKRDDVRRFLSLIAKDGFTKLTVLEDTHKRLTLYKALLTSYLQDKKVDLSKEGMRISTRSGQVLTADMLSSGEQHILVLFFRLLFGRLGVHHLVMIDEPELSLHARWQLRFIDDLQTIRSVTQADFLLASHSPLIFQGHWDSARELAYAE